MLNSADFWWGVAAGAGAVFLICNGIFNWLEVKSLTPRRIKRRRAFWQISRKPPQPERPHAVTQRDSVPASVERTKVTTARVRGSKKS